MDREEFLALLGLVKEIAASVKRLEDRMDEVEHRMDRLEEAQTQTRADLYEFRLEVRERLDRRLFELENKT